MEYNRCTNTDAIDIWLYTQIKKIEFNSFNVIRGSTKVSLGITIEEQKKIDILRDYIEGL